MANMTEKRQLGDIRSMNIKGADEENTLFGLLSLRHQVSFLCIFHCRSS
jgi:hypothetical protein